MKKSTKTWLIVGAALVFIGIIIFITLICATGGDFMKISTTKYETNTYKINESFNSVAVITNTADIEFVYTNELTPTVVCYERENAKHSVKTENDTLTLEIVDTRKWYYYIGINFVTPKITVYLPSGEYGDLTVTSNTGNIKLCEDFKFKSIDVSTSTGDVFCCSSATEAIKIKTNTGKIRVDGISARSLELSVSTGYLSVTDTSCGTDLKTTVSTGELQVTDTKCKSFISVGGTGDVNLINVIAEERLSIERSTGDVEFEACDAGEIFIKTSTGDVEGSLLSEKVFIVNTSTGDKDVPNTITGGRCEITTGTGDVEIYIKN